MRGRDLVKRVPGVGPLAGPAVLYRRQDIEALVARLESTGHTVAARDFDPGDGVLNGYIDGPP